MALAQYPASLPMLRESIWTSTIPGSNDRYQKMVLDVTSGGGSFDVYQFAYQWKHEVATYLADLSHLETEIEGAPSLDLADYPQKALDVYGVLR